MEALLPTPRLTCPVPVCVKPLTCTQRICARAREAVCSSRPSHTEGQGGQRRQASVGDGARKKIPASTASSLKFGLDALEDESQDGLGNARTQHRSRSAKESGSAPNQEAGLDGANNELEVGSVADRLPQPVALLVVDGTNAACIAHHHARKSETNVATEFGVVLQRLQATVKPVRTVVIFDGISNAGSTYKAPQRARAAKAAKKQGREISGKRFGPSRSVIQTAEKCGAAVVVAPEGWEGDDVIATVCARALALRRVDDTGLVAVASGDSDMQQVLRAGRVVWLHQLSQPTKACPDRIEVVTEEAFEEFHKFPPQRYADMLALCGKPEAGVPGVPGISRKHAKRLIGRFGNVHRVVEVSKTGEENFKNKEDVKLAEKAVLKSLSLVSLRIAEDGDDVLPPELDLEWPSV